MVRRAGARPGQGIHPISCTGRWVVWPPAAAGWARRSGRRCYNVHMSWPSIAQTRGSYPGLRTGASRCKTTESVGA
eukprot:2655877-Prymnesium_polylepis.1